MTDRPQIVAGWTFRTVVAAGALVAGVAACADRDRVATARSEARAEAGAKQAVQELEPTGELVPDGFRGNAVQPGGMEPTDERVASELKLPPGFEVRKFAEGLGAPRMMAVGPDGTLYVTRRKPGDVLVLRDIDGDGEADEQKPVVQDLDGAHGIALAGDRMYICTVDALYAAEFTGGEVGKPAKILGDLPPGGRHPNRTLAVHPKDGTVFITVGSTCNCCVEKHPESAAIVVCNPDGSGRRIFARGLRNTLGFGWHPVTGELWGMDHNSDWLGDTQPPEELNKLQDGRHYGWPLAHGNNELIPEQLFPPGFDPQRWKQTVTPMVIGYDAHAAPLQMAFYTGSQFPAEYHNDAFVAMHGSWNRKPPIGYEVVRIDFDSAGTPVKFEPFLRGFLMRDDGSGKPAHIGRPAGIAMGKDGALFVGDDAMGVIYRIAYTGDPQASGSSKR